MAFSPDGSLLATAGDDRTVRLWEVATGTTQTTLTGHSDWLAAVVFSPDGRLLASVGAEQMVRLWDAAGGTAHATLTGHTSRIWDVAFSPDGRLLASVSADGTVRVWETVTGRPRAALRADAELTNCAWHPHNPMIVLTGDAGVYLLDYRA